MMHDRPNDPEYCQNIYDAAQAVVEFYEPEENRVNQPGEYLSYFDRLNAVILNLKRALEGKG